MKTDGPSNAESSATLDGAPALIGYGEAMARLRADPDYADLIRDTYLGPDPVEEARRFEQSAEWQETRRLLGARIGGARVIDLGAGTGIASYAFGVAGARDVFAVEPWIGSAVGRDAIESIGLQVIHCVDARGEQMPFETSSIDIVYARQTLHHADDLDRMLAEIARVLRPGGALFTCRDHVADDETQLAVFLAGHPVHRLAGGEHAYPLDTYVGAIRSAGLRIQTVIAPWDSVINAFPHIRSEAERTHVLRRRIRKRWGVAGRFAARIPGIVHLEERRIASRRDPGRPYSFLAVKPG